MIKLRTAVRMPGQVQWIVSSKTCESNPEALEDIKRLIAKVAIKNGLKQGKVLDQVVWLTEDESEFEKAS